MANSPLSTYTPRFLFFDLGYHLFSLACFGFFFTFFFVNWFWADIYYYFFTLAWWGPGVVDFF